jgi:hypothetical protein
MPNAPAQPPDNSEAVDEIAAKTGIVLKGEAIEEIIQMVRFAELSGAIELDIRLPIGTADERWTSAAALRALAVLLEATPQR